MFEKQKATTKMGQALSELEQIAAGHIPYGTIIHDVDVQRVPSYSLNMIKAIRAQNKLTQAQLAIILAVSPRTVEAWEIGRSKPNGSARRLLQLISVDPKLAQAILDMTVWQA